MALRRVCFGMSANRLATSARHFCHLGASLLPLRRVPLAFEHVGEALYQLFTFKIIYLIRAQSISAVRLYGFTTSPDSRCTSARQLLQFGPSLLPLRRVPLACRRSSFTIFHVLILAVPIYSVLKVSRRYGLQLWRGLALRRVGFSTSARLFEHFGASVSELRRIGFSTSARILFWHVGGHLHHVGGARSFGMSARFMTCRRVASANVAARSGELIYILP